MISNKKYKGVVVPMVTPVTNKGELDVPAVERIVTFLGKNNVSPLLMGTTGEGNSVSSADGLLLVETAVKANRQLSTPITIYAGLTGNCFAEQLRRQGRVNFTAPAVYTADSRAFQIVCRIIDKVKADSDLAGID